MAHDRVNVVADDFCFEEGMTKEQIENAMAGIKKYLVPTVEKVWVRDDVIYDDTVISTIDTSISSGGSYNSIDGTLKTLIDGTVPTLKIWSGTSDVNIKTYDGSPKVDGYISGTQYTAYHFAQILSNTIYVNNMYMMNLADVNYPVEYLYDLKNVYNFRLNLRVSNYASTEITVEYSEDGENWTTLTLSNVTITATITARYVRIRFINSNNQVYLYYCYFDNVEVTIPKYKNEFTLADIASFNDNQIVSIQAPATTDITDVVQNTINDKAVNQILESSKYYDLVYNNNAFSNSKLILDMTLTENVTEVELDDLLESNGVYAISINGTSSAGTLACLYDGTNTVYIGTMATTKSIRSALLFINNNYINSFYDTNSSNNIADSISSGNVNLSNISIVFQSTFTLQAGTNIQIRRLD